MNYSGYQARKTLHLHILLGNRMVFTDFGVAAEVFRAKIEF